MLTVLDTIRLHCMFCDLISYEHTKELLKEVLHTKEGQKWCRFHSQVNVLCLVQKKKDITNLSA